MLNSLLKLEMQNMMVMTVVVLQVSSPYRHHRLGCGNQCLALSLHDHLSALVTLSLLLPGGISGGFTSRTRLVMDHLHKAAVAVSAAAPGCSAD